MMWYIQLQFLKNVEVKWENEVKSSFTSGLKSAWIPGIQTQTNYDTVYLWWLI